ncbi:MAG: nucleotide exchange factor GrpE [Actinomycetota bacterium]|nr:nucleotide exchange factor GrpE [Actinomycetota bacterium]
MSARRMEGNDRAAQAPAEDPETGAGEGAEEDSIEILEVVGVDETTGVRAPRARTARHPAEDSAGPDAAPVAPDDRTGHPADPSQALRDKEKYYDLLLRKQAEFDNFRKRTEKERDEHRLVAVGDFLRGVLPVMDNLERALTTSAQTDSPLRQGVVLIHQQLVDVLTREGLRPVDTVGLAFDPHVHEAVETRSVEGFAPGTVIEEMQKGYTFNGRLLRPALVRVAARQEGDEGQPGGDRRPDGAHGGTEA